MFARRKKSEGFEWHRYIPTVVRNRREQRRQRVVEARQAAGQQVNAAGAALAAGSRAAGAAARDGARAGAGALGLVLQGLWNIVCVIAGKAGEQIAIASRPLIAALARPNIGGPIALAAAIALGSGVTRYRSAGLDSEALITLAIAVALVLASLPWLSNLTGIRMPRFPSLGISPRIAGLAVLAALVAGGAFWFSKGGKTNLAGITSAIPLIGGSKPIEGRASALGGDILRVGRNTVRLAGIEAPDRSQRCGAGNRGWRCGAAAEAALGRLANGRVVTCTTSGTDAAGRALAYCSLGKSDINAELVRRGHVFAEGGLFARYSGLEREARNAKAGIWSSGEPERPSEFRAKSKRPTADRRTASRDG